MDLLLMSEGDIDVFGFELHLAQMAKGHDQAKPLKGFVEASVMEVANALRLCSTMPKELEMIEIETGSANVYEDLKLPDAAQMQIKATLAAKIGEIIKHRRLTQNQATEILGMPQPKLSDMLRGRWRGISKAKMLECMNRLGRDIAIVVRKPSRSCATGRTRVVFA